MSQEFMPPSFSQNRRDPRPARVPSTGRIEIKTPIVPIWFEFGDVFLQGTLLLPSELSASQATDIGQLRPCRLRNLEGKWTIYCSTNKVAVCAKYTLGDTSSPVGQKPLKYWFLRLFTFLVGVSLMGLPLRSQEQRPGWQAEVRKCAEAQDWDSALRVIDRESALAPQDMDVRAWRARVLVWSGHLTEAESQYLEILRVSRNDPDNWMGLANVYLREGKTVEGLRALDTAVELDPTRADLHAARARVLRAGGERNEARLEFQKALNLDPTSVEARGGLISLRPEPKHELRFGQDNDLFNFAGANHDEWTSLASQWTPHWATSVAGSFYQRGGAGAGKFAGSVTGRKPKWGALTVGGAIGHDNAVIPKSEAFFDVDHGWKSGETTFMRGVEIVYGQHWYWYQSSRILTLSGTAIFYLP